MLRLAQLPTLTLVASLTVASCGVNDAEVAESTSQEANRSDESSVPADPEAIRSFEISVPQSVLDDLQDRLARTRFPDEIDGAGWDYGANVAYMKELVQYWHDEFDWREQERRLNEFD